MPAFYTHERAARDIYALLPPAQQNRIANPSLYLIGSQGGDFGFFYPFAFGERNLGGFLHKDRAYPVFFHMAEYCKTREDALSYCLGYVAHYAADTAFHPYVYAAAAQRGGGYFYHAALERAIDGYFRKQDRQEGAPREESALLADGEFRLIADVFSFVNEKCGRQKLKAAGVKRAYGALDFFMCRFMPRFIKEAEITEEEERMFERDMRRAVLSGVALSNEFLAAVGGKTLRREAFARNFSGLVV